ncbi:hypothetical protein Tco_0890444 [Tanacetum coccineum]|uniref:Uncharacterized protein n=1 Tax=Tanacetum coccineum TaxID=301880 RepID=A0ABQ5C350_9ASTR
MTKSKSFNKSPKQIALYHALMKSILKDEDAIDEGVAEKLKKRKPNNTDKDEGPSAGSDRGKCAQAEETMFEARDTQGPQNLGEDTGNTDEPLVVNFDPKDWFKKPKRPPTPDPEWNKGRSTENNPTQKRLRPAYNILKGNCRSYVELDYNIEECYKAQTGQLDWNNPEGDRYPFELSKPLHLVMSGNRQIVSVDYFFNNDLAYLQGGSTDITYTTSLTKTKAAKYELPGIEYMVPNFWSPVKVAYDNHALLGTSHWGPKRQSFYGYASNMVSIHDVYSTKRILAVTNVKVKEWYGYGHLRRLKLEDLISNYTSLWKATFHDFIYMTLMIC